MNVLKLVLLSCIIVSCGCTKNKDGKPKVIEATNLSGKELFMKKACVSCHTVDGNRKIGPSMKGIWGKEVELADGRKILRDKKYMRASILNIKQYDIKGYPNGVMPVYEGRIAERDLDELVKYIESLAEVK